MILPRPTLRYHLWCHLVTWIGRRMCALRPPQVRGMHLRQLLAEAQPGDVVLRSNFWTLANWLIPGRYAHSGLVVTGCEVVHALADGVQRCDLLDFGLSVDRLCLFRPAWPSELAQVQAIDAAEGFLGVEYDFAYTRADEGRRVYCHELVYRCLTHAGLHAANGRYITADTLFTFPGQLVLEVPSL